MISFNDDNDKFELNINFYTLEATLIIKEVRIELLLGNSIKIYTEELCHCGRNRPWEYLLIVEEDGRKKEFQLTPGQFDRVNKFIKAWREIDPNLEKEREKNRVDTLTFIKNKFGKWFQDLYDPEQFKNFLTLIERKQQQCSHNNLKTHINESDWNLPSHKSIWGNAWCYGDKYRF